jgi:hypothetical protein
MGDAIAHIFLSFGFADKDFLAISIETRRERHETYSTVAGFFKQYELFYVVADEWDLIGLRPTTGRIAGGCLSLLTRAPADNARLFLDYIREINSLQKSLSSTTRSTNCTTSI